MEDTELGTSTECFLERVIREKRKETSFLKDIGLTTLEELAESAPSPRDFLSSLRNNAHTPIIAEIKQSAPSWGDFHAEVDVKTLAKTYQSHGAAAISVLTDQKYFGGLLDDLISVRAQVNIPVLRKDFIVNIEQIYQSRAAGADAVLLIAAALDDSELKDLYNTSKKLRMTPLLEVHDEHELHRVLKLDPEIIGVNNRNLKTLQVDLRISESLRQKIPQDVITVAESGITSGSDIKKLLDVGIDGFLVGTSFMKASDPGKMLDSFVNVRRSQ